MLRSLKGSFFCEEKLAVRVGQLQQPEAGFAQALGVTLVEGVASGLI
jgi:hypothetical protein